MPIARAQRLPLLGEQPPRRNNAFTRALGRTVLAATGWRLEGEVPDIPKCVAILAPHTSNLDMPLMVAMLFGLDLKMSWLAKHTIFWWPLGPLLRWMGGISVDRREATDVVAQAVERLRDMPRIFLGVAPEGTRTRVGKWKTGFYRMATQAAVPIVTVAFDYPNRRAIVSPPFDPTGDLDADLAVLQARFTRGMARHPERYV